MKKLDYSRFSFYRSQFLFLLLIIIQACTGADREVNTIEEKSAIVVKEDYGGVKFQKAVSEIPAGKIIGGYNTGWAKILQEQYYATGQINETYQQIYQDVVISELTKAGYSKQKAKSIFESTVDNKERFLVGAILEDMTQNIYSMVGYRGVDVMLNVRWEIFDQQEQKVVFTKKSKGAFEGKSDVEAYRKSIEISFVNLLSDKMLVEQLSNHIKTYPKKDIGYLSTIVNYSNKINDTTGSLNLDFANRCVFQIVGSEKIGSGFVINSDGYGLTNYHVISGNTQLKAIFANGTSSNLKIVSSNEDKDLSLIKLEGSGFEFLPLASADEMKVGENVFAIGTPLGNFLSNSISKGIVSGIREGNNNKYVQTDASINPGNSGGPLIGENGKVLGIVTLKLSGPGFEGLGFAICSEEAIKLFNLNHN